MWHTCRRPTRHRVGITFLTSLWFYCWCAWGAWDLWTLLAVTFGTLGLKAVLQWGCQPEKPKQFRRGLALMGAGAYLMGRKQ